MELLFQPELQASQHIYLAPYLAVVLLEPAQAPAFACGGGAGVQMQCYSFNKLSTVKRGYEILGGVAR